MYWFKSNRHVFREDTIPDRTEGDMHVETVFTTGTNTWLKIRIKKNFWTVCIDDRMGCFAIRNLNTIAARCLTSLNIRFMALAGIFAPCVFTSDRH
jgi:hypothetical protein